MDERSEISKIDNPEYIRLCLNCAYANCKGCLSSLIEYDTDEKVIELWNVGWQPKEIAYKINKSYRYTMMVISRHLQEKYRRKNNRELFLEMWDAGMNESEIAQALELSFTTVDTMRRKSGFTKRYHKGKHSNPKIEKTNGVYVNSDYDSKTKDATPVNAMELTYV